MEALAHEKGKFQLGSNKQDLADPSSLKHGSYWQQLSPCQRRDSETSHADIMMKMQRERCPAFLSAEVTLFCTVCWQCSYIPPCARDDQENSENVTYKQKYWKEKVGSQPFTCYFNQHLRPDDVMLKRTHDETVLLHCFLWPLVTFLVGVLIVVLTICAKSLAVRAEAIKKKKHL
ncbi:calcium-activated potassium channel subunit beta-4 [Egretta garzetta]|uniref:calcium-activated potassium channel subunit beta-4 n=1 Tax=Egretta garzetta TaxID=188379 RepID=UPI00051F078D|nr:calcium-activated potassium channel subunit beta-4 [Egretta garzetta]